MSTSSPSIQRASADLIAERAKSELRSLDPRWPHAAAAERIVEHLVSSMTLVHDYSMNQLREESRQSEFLLTQMHELLDSLMAPGKPC